MAFGYCIEYWKPDGSCRRVMAHDFVITLGTIQNLVVLYAANGIAGIAQLTAFSSCTYVLNHTLPNWVMSRVASVYQLVFQGAIFAYLSKG